MRVLITGVTGFIGSHLANFCLKEGHIVLGTARAPSTRGEQRLSKALAHRNFFIQYIDLTRGASGICESIDLVFNLAAMTFVDHSILDPIMHVRNNLLCALYMMEDARRY